ncbi:MULTISPECIES: carbohydrate kinase [unclassified Methylomonas]|uniref:carbohydrate kinase family protein n=1 Tax=unclassified Methylomonas TaxID=2608980 RepID=UPI0008D90F7B|nr:MULTISPECIES: carbohydrate kinase [unclassified Methylomonas]NJA07013.1 carbohydrate kinase [Methylococcaceae bacterium WWC4]OHX38439.1 carbohydrate kinase [Methylomonas sp. LWB]WGS87200.1 carbohydrate kinase [Methylomonas sp. UP202]
MNKAQITLFGEVLFDCFPDGSRVLGGAPFNVAWHLQAFGDRPRFISRVGGDAAGNDILAAMTRWDMDPSDLQIDPTRPTGTVAVSITDDQPDYQILDRQAYDFIQPVQPGTGDGLLYHGSLALRGEVSGHTWTDLASAWRGPVFLDVNLRAPWWQPGRIFDLIAGADWLKLNDAELAQLFPGTQDIADKMRLIVREFDLQGIFVTCGEEGALALTPDGELLGVTPNARLEVADTVGAGDAFAAVLLHGIASTWPLPLTLRRAQDFASALVGRHGATVEDPAFYQHILAGWQ